MSDDDIEKDDMDNDMDEAEEGPVASASGGGASASDMAPISEEDLGSVRARESLRAQLRSDVEAFLASGGRITQVAANVVADPPRKPQSNYGGQPI